ncbi:hypothetical protein GC167_08945 [bacterium]|nr:hypothetical protein [bacterium]
MELEIITPERRIFEGQAKAVQLPGKDGLFQMLDDHAPLIAALGSGRIKVELDQAFVRGENTPAQLVSEGKLLFLDIKGGVVEMNANKAIVLVS